MSKAEIEVNFLINMDKDKKGGSWGISREIKGNSDPTIQLFAYFVRQLISYQSELLIETAYMLADYQIRLLKKDLLSYEEIPEDMDFLKKKFH